MLYEIHEATIVAADVWKEDDDRVSVVLQFQLDGDARTIVGKYEICDPSAEAEERGRMSLAEVCRAVGLARFQDVDDLVGKTVEIRFDARPATVSAKRPK